MRAQFNLFKFKNFGFAYLLVLVLASVLCVCETGFAADGKTTEPPVISAEREGVYPRITDSGELRLMMLDVSGKTRMLEKNQVLPLLAELSSIAQQYPCGDQALPENLVIRHGVIELNFKIKEMCDSGKGLNYVLGSTLQKRLRPGQGTLVPGISGGAKPSTTGFGAPKKE